MQGLREMSAPGGAAGCINYPRDFADGLCLITPALAIYTKVNVLYALSKA